MNKTNPTKSIAILVILLLTLTPITFAVDEDEETPLTDLAPKSAGSDSAISSKKSSEAAMMSTASVRSSQSGTSSNVFVPQSVSNNLLNKFEPKGQFYTDLFTGSAGYSYAIEVSPGINGLGPAISLNYNHHQTAIRGELGQGWSISKSYIFRDIQHTRSDTADDFFYLNLNGAVSKLIYNSAEGRYHTEQETYIHVKKEGDSWTVKTKDGTIHRFGSNSTSRLNPI